MPPSSDVPASAPQPPAVPAAWPECIRAVAQHQDRAAFAALFAHFAPRVKTLMLRSGVDDAAAEELAQETLLIVWRKAAMFDPSTAGAGAWIFTIARNLRVDALRRGRSRDATDGAAGFLQEPAPDLDTTIASDEAEARIRSALKELPPAQWDVVERSFFQDKAHGDIAGDLGIPLGTVKSRLRLALAKLRGLLGDLT